MAGEFGRSAYKTVATVMDATSLASILTGSTSGYGAEQDNSANRYEFADVVISLGSMNVTSATAYLELYVVGSPDGTNYPDVGTASASPGAGNRNYLVGTVAFSVLNAAQRQILKNVPLPPSKYKVFVRNQLGVTTASTSSVVEFYPWNRAYS